MVNAALYRRLRYHEKDARTRRYERPPQAVGKAFVGWYTGVSVEKPHDFEVTIPRVVPGQVPWVGWGFPSARRTEDMPSEPIFRVSNHHTPSCGRPPSADGDAPELYHGYFENRYGEQMLLVYDRVKDVGLLHPGDAGWEHPCRVVEGRPEGPVMSPEEGIWLEACLRAARS